MALKDFLRKKPVVEKQKSFFYIPPTTVKEEGKGQVVSKPKRWPKEDIGEEHPFDPSITEGLVKNYGMAAGIVDKYVNYIWGQGFYVECKEPNGEKALKIINDFNKEVGITVKGRAWVKEALTKPGGYFEIERTGVQRDPVTGKRVPGTGKIAGLKLLDGKYIWVRRDRFGKVLGYTQYIGNSFFSRDIKANAPTPFDPDEILALHFNVIGDGAYGLGIIWPNVTTFEDMRGLEVDMHKLIHRKANSPLHVKIGTVSADGAVVDMPSSEQVDAVKNDVQIMTSGTEFVTDPTWNISIVDFGKMGEKFDAPLKHNIFRLVVGTGMPEVIMGAGNIAEGLANEQGDDWERQIVTKQEQAEYVIEKLYRQVLLDAGLNIHVEVVWGQPTNKEQTEKIDQIVSILSLGTPVQPKLQFELEKQIAQLMGIDPLLLEEPSEQKEKEDSQEQPNVPGDKNSSSSSSVAVTETAQSTTAHIAQTASEEDPFRDEATVTEWVGFNYREYINSIVDVTKADKFELLAAVGAVEATAGYLDAAQIDALKNILIDAFKEGKSIKHIANRILDEVKPGDLYKMNADGTRGNLVLSEAPRTYNIARSETVRLSNLGSQQFYKDNAIVEYKWVASIGPRTCALCEELNGKVNPISSTELPPLHSMCRCTIVPVVNNG